MPQKTGLSYWPWRLGVASGPLAFSEKLADYHAKRLLNYFQQNSLGHGLAYSMARRKVVRLVRTKDTSVTGCRAEGWVATPSGPAAAKTRWPAVSVVHLHGGARRRLGERSGPAEQGESGNRAGWQCGCPGRRPCRRPRPLPAAARRPRPGGQVIAKAGLAVGLKYEQAGGRAGDGRHLRPREAGQQRPLGAAHDVEGGRGVGGGGADARAARRLGLGQVRWPAGGSFFE